MSTTLNPPANKTIKVDADQFWRDGYLTAPSVLTAEQIVQMRSESDRLLRLHMENPQRYKHRIQWEKNYLAQDHLPGMDKVIRKLEPISDLSSLFAQLAHDTKIVTPVSAIFGEPVELFEDKLNYKLPGGSPYAWHQDWSCCWRAHTDELITCFIYLDDADEVNGCLQVVPGSHIGKKIYPFKDSRHFEIDPAAIDKDKIVPVPLKAGEMIFFDSYLLHYSDLNRSNSPRRAIIYTYNPARLGKINEHRFPQDE